MKKILAIIFVVALFSCRFSYAQTTDTLKPEFKFLYNESVTDLGEITMNTQTSYQFEFRNSGGKELIISDMYIARNEIGPVSQVNISWSKKPVKPGKRGMITILFTSKNEIGSFQFDVYVSSNVWSENYRLLQIKGTIMPEARTTENKLKADGLFRLLTPVSRGNTK